MTHKTAPVADRADDGRGRSTAPELETKPRRPARKSGAKQNDYLFLLDKITKRLTQARPRPALTHRVTFKPCFGAVAGYVDGRIFISCGAFGVALRLPPDTLARLFKEQGVKRLQYFPHGHIKKEYAVLPQRITGNERRLKELIERSIKYAVSSP